jgi:hypothetical protein
MSNSGSKIMSILYVLVFVGVILFAYMVYEDFTSDDNDGSWIKQGQNSLNSFALKGSSWFRSLFGGQSTDVSPEMQKQIHDAGIPDPSWTLTDLVPYGVNTSSWSYDPDVVTKDSSGYSVSGSW